MDDWVMVPRKITLEMAKALEQSDCGPDHPIEAFWQPAWQAALAVAPQQQAEPALIGSDLFPSTIRLADGRDVQLGELVRRAAHGLEATQWNLLPQKARDSGMVNALDDWQRELTAQQQAEPVAFADEHVDIFLTQYNDVYCHQRKAGVGGGDAERAAMRQVLILALGAYKPRITAAQVEELKRLADAVEDALRSVVEAEYAAMGDPSLKYKRNELDEARVALHAALDALTKGTP